jgi:hypothetical protein
MQPVLFSSFIIIIYLFPFTLLTDHMGFHGSAQIVKKSL